jgi:hypothetical protein
MDAIKDGIDQKGYMLVLETGNSISQLVWETLQDATTVSMLSQR